MNFILSTEESLGPLTFLRIWHDNSGHGKLKGWFLDQIQVTDLQTGEKYERRCMTCVVVAVVIIFVHCAVKATVTNAPQSQLNK